VQEISSNENNMHLLTDHERALVDLSDRYYAMSYDEKRKYILNG
jgi:hypothetical protein